MSATTPDYATSELQATSMVPQDGTIYMNSGTRKTTKPYIVPDYLGV